MAATFGNLDLESLGVVGEPSVEYAKFETKVSEPDGYDGGVLANFRRGATKIKFNLALDGDRGSIVAKMNQLAAELALGQQELVLPNMTDGYHFDASANCALQPVEYVDGFVLPLEFAVPEGCAVSSVEMNINLFTTRQWDIQGFIPAEYTFEGRTIDPTDRMVLEFREHNDRYKHDVVYLIEIGDFDSPSTQLGIVSFSFDSKSGEYQVLVDGEPATLPVKISLPTQFYTAALGSVFFINSASAGDRWSIKYKARRPW